MSSRRLPPSPDVRDEPAFPGELTLEITYSGTKRFRTVITRDQDGRFRVRRERWETETLGDGSRGYWRNDAGRASIAASLEIARELAEEKLAESGDGPAMV